MPAAPRCARFIVLAASIVVALCRTACADRVLFPVSPTTIFTNPGGTEIFDGTTSNNLGTGETLDAFSFFFNFNNFDVSAVANPVQLLPINGVDFNIRDGKTGEN